MRQFIAVAGFIIFVLSGCGGANSSPAPADAADDLGARDAIAPAIDSPDPIDTTPPDAIVALDAPDAVDIVDVPADSPLDAPDVSGCPAGQTRCGDACVDTQSDPAHCGSCVLNCRALPGVDAPSVSCARGACAVHDHCALGFGDCDSAAANGCEADLSRSVSCGACGNACSGATPTCSMVMADGGASRACTSGCTPMTPARCGGSCVDTRTDPLNCGACGARCSPPNATPSCVAGACAIGACTSPFANCDAVAANGCETDTSASTAHCGACGVACAPRANSSPSCARGACTYTCNAGFGDCDGNAANGCETNLATTASSCGMCGRSCALSNATAGCNLGACTVASCAVGFGDCNGNAADGCEVDVRTSVSNCGTCGRVCTLLNATPVCSAGTCAIASCGSGFGNCDGNPANGCETTLSTPTNCGTCGLACPTPAGPHTVARCSASGGTFGCGLVCESGYLDCDSNLANGCEATGACTVDRELFYDGFESSGGRWSMDPPWRVTNAGYYSPCAGTLEMFGERTVFDGCVLSGDVTLISPIDISRATTLTLTHQSRTVLGASGAFSINVSTDGGRTWSNVGSPGVSTCGVRSIDLGAFVGRATLLLRFSYSSGACETNFWRLDEVRVRALVRNY